MFWVFNLIILVWLVTAWTAMSGVHFDGDNSHAAKAGMAIGGVVGTGIIMFCWAIGAFVLGLFVMFTRGRKVITEEYG
jgi:hypothetical protein